MSCKQEVGSGPGRRPRSWPQGAGGGGGSLRCGSHHLKPSVFPSPKAKGDAAWPRQAWRSGLPRRAGAGSPDSISILCAQPCCQQCPQELQGCELSIHSALHSVHIECGPHARPCKGGQHARLPALGVLLSGCLSDYFAGLFLALQSQSSLPPPASGQPHRQRPGSRWRGRVAGFVFNLVCSVSITAQFTEPLGWGRQK